jgi:hypothetical protein
VQALILLAIYTLASADSGNATSTVAMAMRLAISLNFHRADPTIASVELSESQSRAFWSLYNLDRLLAAHFGLPLSIADNEITVEVGFYQT